METWKSNKHRKTFTYNMPQNRGNLSSLLIESMQNS
jgi:hypothetical protein